MTVGRPTKYLPEYCEQLIQHMSEGYSFESFAGKIGVSKQTIYDWEKANKDFLDAKRRAFEVSRLFWEKQGIDGLFSESFEDKDAKTKTSKSINATVWLFNMKNRFGWRDKQPGEEDRTITHSYANKSDEELDKELEAIEAGED